MESILALDGARELHWLFETHDLWVKAQDCRLLLDHIPDPAFGALWDMGHTWRVGREKPADSWAAIGARTGYTHVKDAVYDPASPLAMQDGWHYHRPRNGRPAAGRIHPFAESQRLRGLAALRTRKTLAPQPARAGRDFPDLRGLDRAIEALITRELTQTEGDCHLV